MIMVMVRLGGGDRRSTVDSDGDGGGKNVDS